MTVLLLVGACSNPPSTDIYPGATSLDKVESSSAVLYEESGADNACETKLETYATGDDIDEVVEYFEDDGFQGEGKPHVVDGSTMRWIAVHSGDEDEWAQIDVSTGEVAGHPDWETVFQLATPACQS